MEVVGADIAKGIGGDGSLQPIKIGLVRVEQPHAGSACENTHRKKVDRNNEIESTAAATGLT
jgi:hypothetical protein